MSTENISKSCDIAIVGIGSIFPGTLTKNEFWNDIYNGTDRITTVPSSHWDVEEYFAANPLARDKTYCQRGGFLPTVNFDPLAFGIPPNTLTATDSGQILGLLVAKQTLDDFCEAGSLNVERERVSVILGTTGATELITDMASRLERPKWFKALLEEGVSTEQAHRICERVSALYPEWQESTFPGLLSNVIAGRIANRLNLKGTNLVTDAACASSLAALQFSINELTLHQSDLVITGGVDTLNTIFMYMCFSKTPALSPSGDCKPFSENSDGTLIGEGIGMIALKRLRDAEKSGDKIYAVIKGLGTSSDGLGKSIYAPVAEGQTRALRTAYANAGYSPQTVELVEAHGTGTKAGDLCEMESLSSVFQSDTAQKWCALGSVKSQIGHTKAAAGIAGIIKATLALQHKVLPPSIKVSNPHPKIRDEKSPFYVNSKSKPWVRDSSHPRRASVSSFGFGGSNFHVTLEEYRGSFAKKKNRQFRSEVFFFGAPNKEELISQVHNLENELRSHSLLSKIAESNQKTFQHGSKLRLSIVANSCSDLTEKIRLALGELNKHSDLFSFPTGIHFSSQTPSGKLAILFPGQGSQYLEMGSQLSMTFDSTLKTWDRIADARIQESDLPLAKVVFPPSAFSETQRGDQTQRLQRTEWAQPAIAGTSAAMLQLLKSFGIKADYYAGHSLGALTALYAGGTFSLDELISIARQRGLLMLGTGANNGSGMLAVSASAQDCESILRESGSQSCVANVNSPEQTVLSGNISDLEKIAALLTKRNISYKQIPVSMAFHSKQMKGMQASFRNFLNGVNVCIPKVPVLSCLSANEYPSESSAIASTLVDEITAPVQFMPTVEELYQRGVRCFLEVGPKSVLTKLTRRILRGRPFLALAMDENEADPIFSLWNTLAQLAVAGVPINLENLCDEFAAPENTQGQNSSFSVAINGANLRPQAPAKNKGSDIAAREALITKERPKMDSRNNFKNDDRDSFVSRLDLAKHIQSEAARVHSEFQRTFSETHIAFLKSTENCFGLLLQSEGRGQSEEIRDYTPTRDRLAQIEPLEPVNLLSSPRAHTPVQAESSATVRNVEKSEPFKFTSLRGNEQEAPVVHQEAKAEAPKSKKHDESAADLRKILIDVIADKTGYPQELIKLEMSLDTDLGIDSIKRVEIFSQLAEKIPQAAAIDPQVMNKLSTLENILDFLQSEDSSELNLGAKKKSSPPLESNQPKLNDSLFNL